MDLKGTNVIVVSAGSLQPDINSVKFWLGKSNSRSHWSEWLKTVFNAISTYGTYMQLSIKGGFKVSI